MKKLMAILIAMLLILSCSCMAGAEEKTVINVWHRWGGNNELYLNEVLENFEKEYPQYDIEITAKAGEYFELLQSMIAESAAGNELPDIFVGGYAMLNYIATEMTPTTVDELAPSEEALNKVLGRFEPNILEVAAYDGVQVGLPYALSNMVMWVNMDIWENAGLTEADIPTTYEQMSECLEKVVTNTDKEGAVLAINDNWIDQVLSMSHGGSILTEDGSHVSFSSDAVVGMLSWWQKEHQLGHMISTTPAEMATLFYSGDVAIYCATVMNESTFSQYCEFNWKAWPMPTFEGYEKKLPVGGAALISFTKDEAKKAAVWDLLDYMTDDEAIAIFTKTGYICPTNADIPATSNQQVSIDQLPICGPFLPWPGGSVGLEIDSLWANARNEIIWGDGDVLERVTALDEECNAMLDNA